MLVLVCTFCTKKFLRVPLQQNQPNVREWIINKVIAKGPGYAADPERLKKQAPVKSSVSNWPLVSYKQE